MIMEQLEQKLRNILENFRADFKGKALSNTEYLDKLKCYLREQELGELCENMISIGTVLGKFSNRLELKEITGLKDSYRYTDECDISDEIKKDHEDYKNAVIGGMDFLKSEIKGKIDEKGLLDIAHDYVTKKGYGNSIQVCSAIIGAYKKERDVYTKPTTMDKFQAAFERI